LFGFGGNATGNEREGQSFDESINKFAAAHNAMQSTINGLTVTNQQLTMVNYHLQQQLANQGINQQQMMYQMQQQPY
jgi:regulator of replication initiation timing